MGGAERWIDSDCVFKVRTSWPEVPLSPYKERIILCDEMGDLHALLAAYSDSIEFVDTRNLVEASRELQDCPAHAVILNTVSSNNLESVIRQARIEIPDTPIIGCSLPPRIDHASVAGATKRLTKPVRQIDLEGTIESINPAAKRILIVDDNPDVLLLFKRMLITYDNTVDVMMATNGAEALQEMRTQLPDLVLLDIIMPVMDGWQVLEQQQQDEAIKNIPVVVMSAEDVVEQTKSDVLMTTMGTGLSVSQVLHCSVQLSKLLFEPS
jgi:CheY-like chemotaxis protein